MWKTHDLISGQNLTPPNYIDLMWNIFVLAYLTCKFETLEKRLHIQNFKFQNVLWISSNKMADIN